MPDSTNFGRLELSIAILTAKSLNFSQHYTAYWQTLLMMTTESMLSKGTVLINNFAFIFPQRMILWQCLLAHFKVKLAQRQNVLCCWPNLCCFDAFISKCIRFSRLQRLVLLVGLIFVALTHLFLNVFVSADCSGLSFLLA